MGRYCGNSNPPDMTSSENMISIQFKRSPVSNSVCLKSPSPSDHSISGEGFSASYLMTDATSSCGGDYHTAAGLLQSPGYPQPYPHNRYTSLHPCSRWVNTTSDAIIA